MVASARLHLQKVIVPVKGGFGELREALEYEKATALVSRDTLTFATTCIEAAQNDNNATPCDQTHLI